MTILLKKDGRLIIDADQPLEGVSLDNLAAILSGANDGDVIQYDATNGMWVAGKGSDMPENPSVNGTYNLQNIVSSGSSTLSWAADGSDLPTDPAQDGTYNLQNTVSSGTSTLSWASGGSSGGGVFLVTINYDEGENADVLDKTWQEIHDAFVIDGKQVVFTFATNPLYPDFHSYYTLISVTHEDGNPYTVARNHNGMAEVYEAYAASDYPAFRYNND